MHFVVRPIFSDPLHKRKCPNNIKGDIVQPCDKRILRHEMDQLHSKSLQLRSFSRTDCALELHDKQTGFITCLLDTFHRSSIDLCGDDLVA